MVLIANTIDSKLNLSRDLQGGQGNGGLHLHSVSTRRLHRTITEQVKQKILEKLAKAAEDIIELEDDNPTYHIVRHLCEVAVEIGKYA